MKDELVRFEIENADKIIEAFRDTIDSLDEVPRSFIDRWTEKNYPDQEADMDDFEYELTKDSLLGL